MSSPVYLSIYITVLGGKAHSHSQPGLISDQPPTVETHQPSRKHLPLEREPRYTNGYIYILILIYFRVFFHWSLGKVHVCT